VEELRSAEPARQVLVRIAGPLEVEGDRRLIRLLLGHLLDNAWKFTRAAAAAEIVLGRSEQGGETVFFLRDTGAGFDMTYARRLFEPFGRLHPEGEFPGSGMGLAMARRIVHRHAGRIWAEGAVGGGATFSFTLGALT
jgi:signal transduction histidine kinase